MIEDDTISAKRKMTQTEVREVHPRGTSRAGDARESCWLTKSNPEYMK